MVDAELGTKRTCPACGARFYDLQADPVTCPACHESFVIEPILPSKNDAPVAKPETEEPEAEKEDTAVEIVSLEDVEDDDTDDDDETAGIEDVAIDTDDDIPGGDDEDAFLEEDDDDSPVMPDIMVGSKGDDKED